MVSTVNWTIDTMLSVVNTDGDISSISALLPLLEMGGMDGKLRIRSSKRQKKLGIALIQNKIMEASVR